MPQSSAREHAAEQRSKRPDGEERDYVGRRHRFAADGGDENGNQEHHGTQHKRGASVRPGCEVRDTDDARKFEQ